MSKILKQFRYYGDNNKKNYPDILKENGLIQIKEGSIFNPGDGDTSIVALSIQTLPGVQFYLNGTNSDPIIIGSTGIYELNINNAYSISNLCFEESSLLHLIEYNEEDEKDSRAAKGYIIIDIIYEKKE